MDLTTASANVAASPALLPARASRARRRLPCNARRAGNPGAAPLETPAVGLSATGVGVDFVGPGSPAGCGPAPVRVARLTACCSGA